MNVNAPTCLEEYVTMLSLGATALMMRAQCLVHEEDVEKIVRDVIATPAAEQDAEAVLHSLGEVANSLRDTSRRWGAVLKVQLAIAVAEQTFLLAVLASEYDPRYTVVYTVGSTPTFKLWPLALTFKAIGQLNKSLDDIPHKLVRARVFSLSHRAAFNDDYQKLGMHLNIAGLAVSTSRITAAVVAIVVRMFAFCSQL
eukprot:COSAG04_NODE_304_length_17311_cov_13.648792_18_plen_198_part_00